ncbi:GntR family transcriptional regulator [bacterium]|nr:GntR family transcriptional regulator [candidate division CSSED10-310 bacterium]
MFVFIDPASSVPIYRQLVDEVVYRVASGGLREGDQLPSIRTLATELRINPNTVIKAYRELEFTGFAVSHHGKGYFVAASGAGGLREDWRERLRGELAALIARALAVGLTGEEILGLVRKAINKGGNDERDSD